VLTLLAHVLRNSATKQFRSIYAISANIRWCLTGTPIQNSLNDLGALIRFLRVPVLEDIAIFRKHIIAPVFSTTTNRFTNLRRLLEALCLRRTKALLKLPEPDSHIQILTLSDEETLKYRDFCERSRCAIELAVSGHSMKKANQHVVQLILAARLFCNDGDDTLLGRMSLCGVLSKPEEALSYLQTSDNSQCVRCDAEITMMYQEDDRSSRVLTTCSHLICGECLPHIEHELDFSLKEGYSICPICEMQVQRDHFIVRRPMPSIASPSGVRNYPSKLLNLLQNVQNQVIDDKWYVRAKNCVTLVFQSC
jgi:SWI/SNF-related matrix-associated actin-dependent regulator of chromatin subfamily A3